MSKHIVITGASSGIGAETAKALAKDGHKLYLCARRGMPGIFKCDVSKKEDIKNFVEYVKKHTDTVDVLINCAGSFGAIGNIMQIDEDEWMEGFKTNFFGSFLMIKYFTPLMKARNNPRILNFAGGGAFSPFPNYSCYAVSKTSIVRLTENLAIELEDKNIKVNAIAPGFVKTGIHDKTLELGSEFSGSAHFEMTQQKLKEGAVPIEVPVECIKFLISNKADKLNGKTISASFDPWGKPEFYDLIDQVNDSSLYTLRRINPVNLEKSDFKDEVMELIS